MLSSQFPFLAKAGKQKRPRESDFFRRRRRDKRRRNSICGILNVPDFEFGSKNVFTQFSCSSQAFHCISPQWNINLSHLCGFVCPPLIFLYFVFLLPLEGWSLVRTCEVVALTRRLSQLKAIHLNGHLFPSSTLKYPLSVRQGCKGEGGGNPGQCDNHQGSTAEMAVGVRLPSSS